jgi:hypothetical protein
MTTAALSPDAILTRDEVAKWLQVHPRRLDRLGVHVSFSGAKTRRYLVRDVLTWLEQHRRPRPHDGRHV